MDNLLNNGILIVDDDDSIVEALTLLLEEGGHNKLFQAYNGIECLNILEKHGKEIYLIVLGIYMPEMTGLEVLEHMVADNKYITGIIVLTGGGYTKENIEIFYKSETETVLPIDFVKKPFDLDEFLSKIAPAMSIIDKRRREQENIGK